MKEKYSKYLLLPISKEIRRYVDNEGTKWTAKI